MTDIGTPMTTDKPDLVEGAATTARILSQSIIDQGYASTTSNEITRLRAEVERKDAALRLVERCCSVLIAENIEVLTATVEKHVNSCHDAARAALEPKP